jgi:peptidoglycan/xylan/chitin deacetylase (PgdA/CDA1 family)
LLIVEEPQASGGGMVSLSRDTFLARMPLPYEIETSKGVPRAKEWVKQAISWSALALGTIIRVDTREPAIALTFDDGPHPGDTPKVLEILQRHGARATFFMVGKCAAAHPGLVGQVAAAGHAVANHGWDHTSFRLLDSAARKTQIRDTAAALAPHGVALFRPPYGEQSLASRIDAGNAGQKVIGFDVVAEDWRDDSSERIVGRVMRRLRRGSIAVFHDTLYTATDPRYRDRRPLHSALDGLLAELSGEFRFVTVPELLRLGRPVHWHHYHRLPDEYRRRLA